MLSAALLLLASSQDRPKSAPQYREEIHRVKPNGGEWWITMRNSTGKLVFQRRAESPARGWAKDRSLFAFVEKCGEPYKTGYWIGIWRPGKRIRTLVVDPISSYLGEGVYDDGFKVSPTGKYLLLRGPNVQGEGDFNVGALICVDTDTARSVILDWSAYSCKWIDSKTVSYVSHHWELPTKVKEVERQWKVTQAPPVYQFMDD